MAPLDRSGAVVGRGDFEAQLRAAYDQLVTALTAEGLAMTNIVQMTTYIVRESDIAEFYRVRADLYKTLFAEGRYPPHTLLVMKRLVDPDMLVEIQVVAAR
jgi:enamine deaminase RidA (YjgF/YER057c/UK114 family)